jgi:hypothetical protein
MGYVLLVVAILIAGFVALAGWAKPTDAVEQAVLVSASRPGGVTAAHLRAREIEREHEPEQEQASTGSAAGGGGGEATSGCGGCGGGCGGCGG